jgi:hypothetical protein
MNVDFIGKWESDVAASQYTNTIHENKLAQNVQVCYSTYTL